MYYMKRRVDADITLENEDDNLKDYSRSKYLWLSGHDSTIQADILLIVKTFNLNESEIYIYPRYASELTLEIRTDKTEANLKYSDYYILGYFDDKEIFNFNAKESFERLENEIWDENKIYQYCGVNITENIILKILKESP